MIHMRKKLVISFEEIVSLENLFEAWEDFIRGKRNKKDVQNFHEHLFDEIPALYEDLISGQYQHSSYYHFRICDPKTRDIHKAEVRDRLLHHAIHRKLYPFFASTFIADSFSCQNGKGLHRAIDRFQTMTRSVTTNHSKTGWALKCDIQKFFASVDHNILLDILGMYIQDQKILSLLASIIESFHTLSGKGIPLGNLTSQLFSNIYMNEFDQFMKHKMKTKNYIRYADDFLILSMDKIWLINLIPQMELFLSERLGLHLHPKKIFLKTFASGIDFLGWVHFPYHRILRTSSKKRMVKNFKHSSTPSVLASCLGLMSHGDTFEIRQQFLNDAWLFDETLLLTKF